MKSIFLVFALLISHIVTQAQSSEEGHRVIEFGQQRRAHLAQVDELTQPPWILGLIASVAGIVLWPRMRFYERAGIAVGVIFLWKCFWLVDLMEIEGFLPSVMCFAAIALITGGLCSIAVSVVVTGWNNVFRAKKG